jgi:hypothetical protein
MWQVLLTTTATTVSVTPAKDLPKELATDYFPFVTPLPLDMLLDVAPDGILVSIVAQAIDLHSSGLHQTP